MKLNATIGLVLAVSLAITAPGGRERASAQSPTATPLRTPGPPTGTRPPTPAPFTVPARQSVTVSAGAGAITYINQSDVSVTVRGQYLTAPEGTVIRVIEYSGPVPAPCAHNRPTEAQCAEPPVAGAYRLVFTVTPSKSLTVPAPAPGVLSPSATPPLCPPGMFVIQGRCTGPTPGGPRTPGPTCITPSGEVGIPAPDGCRVPLTALAAGGTPIPGQAATAVGPSGRLATPPAERPAAAPAQAQVPAPPVRRAAAAPAVQGPPSAAPTTPVTLPRTGTAAVDAAGLPLVALIGLAAALSGTAAGLAQRNRR